MEERQKWLVGLLGLCGLVLAKIKSFLFFSKLITTAWTMLLSLVLYALAFGWQFAAGFVGLLLAHELGHVLAIRAIGLRAGMPVFIPFLGAVVHLKKPPWNAKAEANIAIGGPALGTLSVLVCLIFYLWTDSKLMLVLAYTGCLINLFNLVPASPLDGGRIIVALSPKLWLVGLAILALAFVKTLNPFLLFILVMCFARAWQAWWADDLCPEYFAISVYSRIKVACWYFGLLAILGATAVYTFNLLR